MDKEQLSKSTEVNELPTTPRSGVTVSQIRAAFGTAKPSVDQGHLSAALSFQAHVSELMRPSEALRTVQSMAEMAKLLKSFDPPPLFGEVQSLQSLIKPVADYGALLNMMQEKERLNAAVAALSGPSRELAQTIEAFRLAWTTPALQLQRAASESFSQLLRAQQESLRSSLAVRTRQEPTVYLSRRARPRPQFLPVDEEQERLEEAQRLVSRIETAVREFVNEMMTRRFGPQWENSRIPPDMLSRWDRNRQRALRAGEADRPLIWFAEFGDYGPVITEDRNWSEVFAPFFRDQEMTRVSFRWMRPIRNPAMHNRPPSAGFVERLRVEVRFVLTAIGRLRHNEVL